MDTLIGVRCAGSLFIFIQLPSRRLCSRKGEMHHQRSSLKMLRRSIFLTVGFEPLPAKKLKPPLFGVALFLARWKGLEPPTFWFVAKHSIQLSYQRICGHFCNRLYIISLSLEKCKS